MQEKTFSKDWLGRKLSISTGKMAHQADAAVLVRYNDTVVLASVVEAREEREGLDFFPLQVEFEERLYAAGIIKGSRWIKREGRPTDDSVLTGRMIDRSIRPLFDDSSRKEVQVVITVLSADQQNDHDIVSLIAASAALSASGVAWAGPIGGIRVGRIEGKLVFNPTYEERLLSDLDLIVAGTDKKTVMIEAGGNEIKESEMLEAIMAGQQEMQGAIDLIKEFASSVEIKQKQAKQKLQDPVEAESNAKDKTALLQAAEAWLKDNAGRLLFDKQYYSKGERKLAVQAIKDGLDAHLFSLSYSSDKRKLAAKEVLDKLVDEAITTGILSGEQRVDGRKATELRQILSEVAILPRNHGTALFSRGETQVLSIVTLGAPGLVQHLEGIEGTETKRFMHHYNFPPYSVGETKPMRGPGRREIGHGALAEKALMPMLPAKEDFAYTIRVVSETLGSNGSSSMASTCAASLALMDAGVPLKRAVAGVAIGLASNADMSNWKVLTDIQDLEDGKGGMDFKIAGTREGITAIQLDTKTNGLTREIIAQALEQGFAGRCQILDTMDQAISSARPELSPYAPRIFSFNINPEKIREVIGSGGKVINKIIAETNVSIDIEDDGLVLVCGTDAAMCEKAVAWIKNIVRDFVAGEVFTGPVVRMLDFGAFVELGGGKDGMVHVSEMAPYRIGKPVDFLSIGQVVSVRVKEIDDQGRVNLTMMGLPENEALWVDEKGKSERSGGFGGNGRPGGGRPNFNRDRGPRPDFRRPRDEGQNNGKKPEDDFPGLSI